MQYGWNFIGNPFNFEIPFSKLSLQLGQPLDIRIFDGTSWSRADALDMLKPFEGYAVFVDDPNTLFINPDLSSVSDNANAAKTNHANAFLWAIRIRARSRLAHDADNLAAVTDQATEEWDRLDRPDPPVIGDYVSVYFNHPEWNKATARYSTDARPAPDDGVVWPVEIVTARRDQVHLTFAGLSGVPSEYEVWLVDEVLGLQQDLRQTDTYTVVGGGARDPRSLKLVVGRPGFLESTVAIGQELPERFELFPNFPNPFNPATTIRYGLPEASVVELVVYDLLGRQVALLKGRQEQTAGYHTVIWDGRDAGGKQVASGIYFVRMQAGRFVQTQKMVLVK